MSRSRSRPPLPRVARTVLALFGLSLLLLGCAQQAAAPAQPAKPAESKPAAPAQKFVAKASAQNGPTDIAVRGLVYLSEQMAKRTNGAVEIQVFHSAQLGTEKQQNEGVRDGSIHLAKGNTGGFADYQPAYPAFSAPFLWDDWAQQKKVVNGPLGQELSDELLKRTGIRVLSYLYYGPRQTTTKNKPIRTPDDIKGLKMRVPEFPLFVEISKAMGASPVPIPYAELYTALQQGVVDGQDNPLSSINAGKFQEVQKYLSLTAHIFNPEILFINDKWLQSLPADLRTAMLEEGKRAGEYVEKIGLDEEESLLKKLESEGMTVVRDVNKESFRKATADVYKKFEKEWGTGVYEKIQEAKKK